VGECCRTGGGPRVCSDRWVGNVVAKQAKAGNFRVRYVHGATLEVQPHDERWQAVGDAVLAHVDGDLAYARVDGVMRDGVFRVMEVELIEPNLYFAAVPKAIPGLVDAIRRRLQT